MFGARGPAPKVILRGMCKEQSEKPAYTPPGSQDRFVPSNVPGRDALTASTHRHIGRKRART